MDLGFWQALSADLQETGRKWYPALNQADVDDLIGDVALYLVRHSNDLPPAKVELVRLTRTVFRHLAVSLLRRRRIRREFQIPLDELWSLEDIEDDPSMIALQDERQRRVRLAIDNVPPKQRTAIRLYYLEGLRLREIATRLKTSTSEVHRRVEAGRELLRVTLNAGEV